MSLNTETPEAQKARWRKIYDYVATVNPGEFHLMNYGYMGAEELPLTPEQEPERLSLQLYHHVCAPVEFQGKKVLEVGCGRGGGTAWITGALNPLQMIGLDFSMEAINLCQSRYGNSPRLMFLQGDAEHLPFPDRSLDIVLNIESSHCYASRKAFFDEVRRVLKPEGHFLLADFFPAGETCRELLVDAGFAIQSREDITAPVLRSCEQDAERRRRFFDGVPEPRHSHLVSWAGVPGSPIYRELETGRTVYLVYHLT